MELDRLLLSEHDFCMICYERPPVLRDRFCWAEEVVAQDRFYCTAIQGTTAVGFTLYKTIIKTTIINWICLRVDTDIEEEEEPLAPAEFVNSVKVPGESLLSGVVS